MPEVPAEGQHADPGLVAAVAGALATHQWGGLAWAAHHLHHYDSDCAICQGDTGRAAAVAVEVVGEQAELASRARCVAELRALAARYRALPAERRAAGKPTNIGQEWGCDQQAMSLDYAADVLARALPEETDDA